MKRLVAGLVSFAGLAAASPALASGTANVNSKAIWIALGVTFMGAFLAIFSSLAAALAARKRQKDDQ